MPKEKPTTDSALHVMDGVPQPGQINPEVVKHFSARKRKSHSVEELVEGIVSGNRTLLSRAITLVESALPGDQRMAEEIVGKVRMTSDEVRSEAAKSVRVGITGVPGVGKSTFIETLGKYLTAQGHKLAVLAIDPSSTRTKGSILGDKTRMEELAGDPNAFIRPSPSAGSLGGVARKTRETIILCEAAGFDVIFVETVGVGQSETAVHGMVDFFLLLMLAGAGDELQGIKRGIIEMADAIVINKADGDNIEKARAAKAEYGGALHLFPPAGTGWTPVVDTCSAQTGEGIEEVWNIIMNYQAATLASGYFHRRRIDQDRQVLHQTIEEELRRRFYSNREIGQAQRQAEAEIASGRLNPYQAAHALLEKYFR